MHTDRRTTNFVSNCLFSTPAFFLLFCVLNFSGPNPLSFISAAFDLSAGVLSFRHEAGCPYRDLFPCSPTPSVGPAASLDGQGRKHVSNGANETWSKYEPKEYLQAHTRSLFGSFRCIVLQVCRVVDLKSMDGQDKDKCACKRVWPNHKGQRRDRKSVV